MTEHPIILKSEKVLAFLNGATQMRVPLKKQPPGWVDRALMTPCNEQGLGVHFEGYKDGELFWWPDNCPPHEVSPTHECSPFGVPGDTVWFKEKWGVHMTGRVAKQSLPMFEYTHYIEDRPDSLERGYELIYQASVGERFSRCMYWRSSTQMPRWASRLVRTVKRVWVEQAEGVWAWCCEFEEKS